MNAAPLEVFDNCFVQLLEKFKNCVAVHGDGFGRK
jgi:hypothetical protein